MFFCQPENHSAAQNPLIRYSLEMFQFKNVMVIGRKQKSLPKIRLICILF